MSDGNPLGAGEPEELNSALRPDLVFRESPHDSCLVFATPERAAAVDSIYRAMEAPTWREFRLRMDPVEFAKLHAIPSDELDDVWREPEDDEPFSCNSLPGFCDGDYPPWLARELDRHLPAAILERFATREFSFVSGPFYEIDVKHRTAILKALADSGLTVEERADLNFW